MRTDRQALAFAALALCFAVPVTAQDPLTAVNAGTEVRSVKFRFEDERRLLLSDMKAQLATTPRGAFHKLRKFLSWLPAVPAPLPHPFDPLTLQRDVVRLRQLYHRNGFLKARVKYDVSFDEADNLVAVEFVVTAGPPLKIASLDFQTVDSIGGSPPALAPELLDAWGQMIERQRNWGVRWTEEWQRQLDDSTTRWLRNRGYPFATAETKIATDTAAMTTVATVSVQPGSRDRIREIVVTGNEAVPDRHLVRQLPVREGEWFDAGGLEDGRQQLMQYDLMRLVLVRVPPDQARDSSVQVRLSVSENHLRVIRGDLGVVSGGGIGGQTDWTHRAFLGGLRTFTVSAGVQTGILPLEAAARQEFRFAVSVFEPYVGDRRLSFGMGPFVEYRDDVRDRSWRLGFQSALVYSTGPLQSVTLGYTFSHRRVLEFGFGDIDPVQYLPLLGLAEPGAIGGPADRFDHSLVTLSASYGQLDRLANPRKGFVIRPRLAVTTPFYNTSEYALFEIGATYFMPIKGRAGATVRADAGRVLPYGSSVRNISDPFVALLQLREATFTAGGSRDVRGWGTDLLGPKLPRIIPGLDSTGATTYSADEYAPVGGLARVVASAQVNIPLPGFGEKLHSFFFVDGARIWTSDSRFRLDGGDLVQDRFFVGTGGGMGYETLVGAVTVALGYKVNPSALDLRDPSDVMTALVDGRPITDVPADGRRRWQIHFAIGATF